QFWLAILQSRVHRIPAPHRPDRPNCHLRARTKFRSSWYFPLSFQLIPVVDSLKQCENPWLVDLPDKRNMTITRTVAALAPLVLIALAISPAPLQADFIKVDISSIVNSDLADYTNGGN